MELSLKISYWDKKDEFMLQERQWQGSAARENQVVFHLNSEGQSLIFTNDTTLKKIFKHEISLKTKNQIIIGNSFRSFSPMVFQSMENEKSTKLTGVHWAKFNLKDFILRLYSCGL